MRPFLSARRPVMAMTLAHLHETYGGVEPYVLDAAGVDAATLDHLRGRLLEP